MIKNLSDFKYRLYKLINEENIETRQNWHNTAIKLGYNFIHNMIMNHRIKDTKLVKLITVCSK